MIYPFDPWSHLRPEPLRAGLSLAGAALGLLLLTPELRELGRWLLGRWEALAFVAIGLLVAAATVVSWGLAGSLLQ